ncbi:aminotransferase class I/II-fold pyridoxal phosphate-dependent enzyme [Pseudoalteromonas piscicida]|uniref:Aminotransferase class I/II-fold pyridoxal phosphate-dependent enzyme n=1 Tax=Pseudoalteromonas piscicida TaxID=43662 RepID=A0AAD0RJ82_PSEO7|nr:aminotransferase class I/II-fold pyridoxal phosphate-dependent enzyme [Pseudoalteromonas piscicida]ASD66621.1 aminotransferase class I/II [Pseudoalteromonas piscicida]AXR02665.1 aminotransferase class I/II-fold pyridoxal phosphate-dependent enzyme [Pseudoalteromonas piscicida]
MELVLPDHIKFSQSLAAPIDINLSDSCAQGVTLSELIELGGGELPDIELGYNPIAGSEGLKAAIKAYHLPTTACVGLTQIVTFSGAQEAIFTTMAQLLNPQDEVVVCTPSYPSLAKLPTQFGAIVNTVPLQEENDWQFDIERLKDAVTAKTKLIIVNVPHNPTGACLTDKEVGQIQLLAEQCGAYILSDEVSAQSCDDDSAVSGRFSAYPRSITLGVLSKSMGLPGIRVGWAICGSKALADTLLAGKSYLSICGSKVDDLLATTALQHSETILAHNAKVIANNVQLMREFVSLYSQKVTWVEPQGGVLSLLRINAVTDSFKWSRQFSEASKTLLLPAKLFLLQSECHFRLGTGKRNFAEGLARLETYL